MRISPCLLSLLLLLPVAAKADTFAFTATGGPLTTSGTFEATKNSDGSYTITSLEGTYITAMMDPGMYSANDNRVFPDTDSILGPNGVSLAMLYNGEDLKVHVYSDGDGYRMSSVGSITGYNAGNLVLAVTPGVAVTPEPTSLLLTLTGMAASCGLALKRYVS